MDIARELMTKQLKEIFTREKEALEEKMNEVVQSMALMCLSDIQKIIQNDELDDSYVVEEIVCIFEKYGIDAGVRHDFG